MFLIIYANLKGLQSKIGLFSIFKTGVKPELKTLVKLYGKTHINGDAAVDGKPALERCERMTQRLRELLPTSGFRAVCVEPLLQRMQAFRSAVLCCGGSQPDGPNVIPTSWPCSMLCHHTTVAVSGWEVCVVLWCVFAPLKYSASLRVSRLQEPYKKTHSIIWEQVRTGFHSTEMYESSGLNMKCLREACGTFLSTKPCLHLQSAEIYSHLCCREQSRILEQSTWGNVLVIWRSPSSRILHLTS